MLNRHPNLRMISVAFVKDGGGQNDLIPIIYLRGIQYTLVWYTLYSIYLCGIHYTVYTYVVYSIHLCQTIMEKSNTP